MSLWYLNILGTWIEVVNHLEKKNYCFFFFKKMDLEILWNDFDTVLLEKYM